MKSASVLKRLLSPVRTKIKREPLLSSWIRNEVENNLVKSWHVKSYVLTKFFQKVIYPIYELLMTYFHEKQIPNCHEFFRQERNLVGQKNMQLCTLKKPCEMACSNLVYTKEDLVWLAVALGYFGFILASVPIMTSAVQWTTVYT